jgi:thiomorpholine-carboxylate dehydrogenase
LREVTGAAPSRQAKAHLEALARVRDFDDVRIWSRTPEHAKRFAEKHGATAMDAESAVRGADVVVTATNALTPILKGAWLKYGAYVNAVGSPRPTWRELDDDVMKCVLVVDSREAALKESGDVILSRAPIYAEIGEISNRSPHQKRRCSSPWVLPSRT